MKDEALIFKYTIALCELYGIFKPCDFCKVWNKYNQEKIIIDEYSEFLNKYNLQQNLFDNVVLEEDYIVIDEVYLDDLLKYISNTNMYIPTIDEIEKLATGDNLDSAENNALMAYLIDNSLMKQELIEGFLYDLNTCIMLNDKNNLQEVLEEIELNEKQKEEMQVYVKNITNAMRLWYLRGHKLAEV